MSQHGRSISEKQNEIVRSLARSIMETEFHGNMSATARALHLTPGGLSEFLSGTRGAGWKLLNALSQKTGKSIDDILEGRRIEPEPGTTRIKAAIGNHQDWLSVSEQALNDKRLRLIPPDKRRFGRDQASETTFAQLPERLDPSWVADLILLVLTLETRPEITEQDERLPAPADDPTGLFRPKK